MGRKPLDPKPQVRSMDLIAGFEGDKEPDTHIYPLGDFVVEVFLVGRMGRQHHVQQRSRQRIFGVWQVAQQLRLIALFQLLRRINKL